MERVQSLLSTAFPVMAITGLLLAGWGLVVTPDELKGNQDAALWGAKAASLSAYHAVEVITESR